MAGFKTLPIVGERRYTSSQAMDTILSIYTPEFVPFLGYSHEQVDLVDRLRELAQDIKKLRGILNKVCADWGDFLGGGEDAPYCGHGYETRGFEDIWEIDINECVDEGSRITWEVN